MGVLAVSYLVIQLEQGKLKYKNVIKKFPDDKDEIDASLREHGTYEFVVGRTE